MVGTKKSTSVKFKNPFGTVGALLRLQLRKSACWVRCIRMMRTSGSTVLATSLFAQGAGPSDETNSKVGAYFKYKGKGDITVQQFFDNAYRNFS